MNSENSSKKKKYSEVDFFKSFLSNYVYPTCTFFTIAVFLTSFIGTLASQKQLVAELSFMALLLLFSLTISIANRVFATKLNSVVKLTVHFIACTAAFVVVFVVFTGYYERSSSAVFIVFFFILAYLLIMSVGALIKNLIFRKKNEDTPYKKQF